MSDSKIVNSEEFLREFERIFGKGSPYFMAVAAMTTTPAAEVPSGNPGNPSSVADGDSSSSEELLHRAEVFERMAFKLEEELRTTKEYLQRAEYSIPCGLCLYENEESDGEHCWNCTRGNPNFVFYAENERDKK